MPKNENPSPVFDPGEEVFYDVPGYGQGKGNVTAFYVHDDGSKLYAIYPKIPRNIDAYKYVCIVAKESNLISAPF